MSARRFAWRWAARVVRREWRQHLVIFVFICVGVAVSVTGALAAFNLVEPPESAFGNGQFSATADDPEAFSASLVEQGHAFARVDTAVLSRDGSTEQITVKHIDPSNSVSMPLFSLVDGAWPEAEGQIALTDRTVSDGLEIDSILRIDGRDLTVVGFVENPTSLSDEFALVAGLEQFDSARPSTTVDFLIDANEADVDFAAVGSIGINSSDGPPARTAATLVVNVVAAFGMLEVGLLVSSAFAVIARRRSRQYGLLAGAGAAPSLIRSTATFTGLMLGALGAGLGLFIGIVTTIFLVPSMESAVGHRILVAVPLWATVPSAIIGVVVATYSARRPAAELTRLSIVDMLSSTRPRPEPAGRAAIVGVVLTIGGIVALVVGFAQLSTALALLGTLLAPIGLLLLSPLVVDAIGRIATRMPLAERLTGRTIARYNRRSAAVVAALALALAIPVAIAVVTSSVDKRAAQAGPNLAENQLIVWAVGADGAAPRSPAVVDQPSLEATRDAMTRAAPGLSFAPINVAVPAGVGAEIFDDGLPETPVVAAIEALDGECTFCDLDVYGFRDPETGMERSYEARISWIASPELLVGLGLDTDWLETGAAALVRAEAIGVASFDGILAAGEQVEVSPTWPSHGSIPDALVSPELVDGDRFDVLTIGWMGTSQTQLTEETRSMLRDTVVGGVVLEFHQPPEPRSTLRATAMLIGIIVGLGLTISAVALLSAELATDRVLLASLGARPRTARRMSAAGAGLLSLAGASIAALIGYVPLIPMLTSRADNFPFVIPWWQLGGVMVAFPLIAAFVAWSMTWRSARDPNLSQSI